MHQCDKFAEFSSNLRMNIYELIEYYIDSSFTTAVDSCCQYTETNAVRTKSGRQSIVGNC